MVDRLLIEPIATAQGHTIAQSVLTGCKFGSYWIPGSSLVKFGVTGCFYTCVGTNGAHSIGFRRFLEKNSPFQDVDTGLITMSYLGNAGWRSKRSSIACIAALPSEMPF